MAARNADLAAATIETTRNAAISLSTPLSS
jgi:hypothetical protein